MTGLSFTGLYFLHKPFADRMAGIIVPRINAGQEPIPTLFQQGALKSAASLSEDQERRLRWESRAKNSELVMDEVFDEYGQFDREKYDLFLYRRAGGGSVAVIPIDGPMARVGYCGAGGNEYLTRILKLAAVHPLIKSVILKVNTPGGTVDSTRMLADAVKNFPKRIYVWTNFCASAGYYVASQADEIWMEDQSVSEVGSIGVLMVYTDSSEALKKEGYKITIYRADGSENKAQMNGIEPVTPEMEAELKTSLNEIRQEFLGYVRRGRAGKLTSCEWEDASMFGPKKALTIGLADRVGSLDELIQYAT
ncbi:S49 family peptidase [Spirosoma rigui]|uniref:S49 family peptidase n=1 Tax=Spirosoma rigui TaxID=564064 RepID=UPI0009B15CD4|nr:S49 family peptidase [Spirosoma rigui]